MSSYKYRVLILGASGMLGSTLFRILSRESNLELFGSIRSNFFMQFFASDLCKSLTSIVDIENDSEVLSMLQSVKPDIVINCIGIIKQLPKSYSYLEIISVNSQFPHRLAKYCSLIGSRLIHFSTDCVFSGAMGNYIESDIPDALDLYGRTKFLGELNYGNCITLRTSFIGHELNSAKSIVDWFLSQSGEVKGFVKAVFSGIPTVEIARVVIEHIIPNPHLCGIYHLSVYPITKFRLLTLIASVYKKDIKIFPDDSVVIDRSLNSNSFRCDTGFISKPWPILVEEMYSDYLLSYPLRSV